MSLIALPQDRVAIDWSDQLSRGLFACFPGNGLAYDAARQRTTTVTGGLTYTRSILPFGSVTVPNWDGTDDDVDFGTIPFLPDFSLLAWVYVADTGVPGYRSAIRTGDVFGTNCNFVFGWRQDTGPLYNLFCYARNAGALKGVNVVGSLTPGWHRVGVSWTSGAQRYFVNGKLVGTSSSTNGADGGVALSFGGLGDSANNVRINKPTFDCRVYNRVLSDGEFYRDYRNSNSIYLPRRKSLLSLVNSTPSTVLASNLVTTASGILVPSLTQTIGGNLVTTASGLLAPSLIQTIGGNFASSASQALTSLLSGALSGNQSAAATGALTPVISKALTNNLATTASGAIAASLSITLANNLVTSDVGVLTSAGSYTAGLSNNLATSVSGSVIPVISRALTDSLVISASGVVSSKLTAALSGNVGISNVGALAANISLSLANNAAVSTAGDLTIFVSHTAALTNNLVTTFQGTLTPKISKPLVGYAVAASEGAVGILGYNAVVGLSGQAVEARTGLLSVFAPNEIVFLNSFLTTSIDLQSRIFT